MKFKYRGYKHEMVSLLVHLLFSLKYKINHDRWRHFIDVATRWDNERNYPIRENLNNDLRIYAREKYSVHPPHMVDVTDRRIWLAIPYCPAGKLFRINITWSKSNEFTFFVSLEDCSEWEVHFAKLLFKIGYDFKNIVRPVEINGQELKVGEWLAALLFRLSGDHAGMLATLDEAEDRK